MVVDVVQTADNKIWVNGKLLYLDMNGQWVCGQELEPTEKASFNSFLTKNNISNG